MPNERQYELVYIVAPTASDKELEALQGTIVRRGQALGISTPIIAALYAELRPHAGGASACE